MFEGLKSMFGTRKAVPGGNGARGAVATKAAVNARPKARRVNLEKRFTILSETSSQGSMSRVYRAMDAETGRTICLKVQDRDKNTAAAARTDPTANRPSEGEIGSRVVHPHVVRTLEYGETTRGEYYVVMEFIDGVSLQFVRESRALGLAAKVDLLAQAAEALAGVHTAGFIHHDFGPRNLLVDREDRVRLIDFGLAVPNTPEFRRPGNRTGTLQYLAPEVIRREPKDERLDIFAWGATAFEFLAGRLPYDTAGDPMTQLRLRINVDPLPLGRVAPHLPTELRTLVDKTLARRPQDRWPRADSLARELRELSIA